jgi:hypothetical protein
VLTRAVDLLFALLTDAYFAIAKQEYSLLLKLRQRFELLQSQKVRAATYYNFISYELRLHLNHSETVAADFVVTL